MIVGMNLEWTDDSVYVGPFFLSYKAHIISK